MPPGFESLPLRFLLFLVLCFSSLSGRAHALEVQSPAGFFTVVEEMGERWGPVLYEKKDFGAIEAEVGRLLQQVPDDQASLDLEWLYFALATVPKENAAIDQRKAVLEEWCAASPNSHVPWLVKGRFLINYGWMIRTSRWAQEVPEGSWKPFHDQLQLAREALEKSRK